MAKHAFEPHVDVHVRRFDLAGDVELARAAGVFGDGDRSGRAFSEIEEGPIESHEFTDRP